MADQAAGQKRERDSGDSRSKKRKYFSQVSQSEAGDANCKGGNHVELQPGTAGELVFIAMF